MRVAVFGGSFNPPHIAHVLAVTYVASLGLCERVLVVPVHAHAFDKHLVPFSLRLSMCREAMGFIPGVEVSDIEASLPPPNYTLHMLRALAEQNPDWQLRLVVGADVLGESHKWHAWDEVCALAPPIVLGRVGYMRPDAPPPVLPDVSSTRIRKLLETRDDDAQRELELLLPRCVRETIEREKLFR
ncbi:MAG: nicotinate-nicotinamide nucleotide adenylyltransferase [Polyangiaceae bacterium]